MLKINSAKAEKILKWKCFLNFNKTIKFVAEWYKDYYKNSKKNMYHFSMKQIEDYENLIKNK